jgi:hypothetical protein
MILANLSQGGQYILNNSKLTIHEEEALEEIKQAELKAKEVECIWKSKTSLLDIDHFYCSNWEKRGDNVGASSS